MILFGFMQILAPRKIAIKVYINDTCDIFVSAKYDTFTRDD